MKQSLWTIKSTLRKVKQSFARLLLPLDKRNYMLKILNRLESSLMESSFDKGEMGKKGNC